MKPEVGNRIRIIKVDDQNGLDVQAAGMIGKEGTILFIDGAGQLHGDWGGLAIIPEVDEFEILS